MAKTKESIVDKEFEDLQPNNKRIKNIIITVAVILVFGLVFFISQKQEEKLNKQSTNNYFHEITVDQYNELLSKGTKIVLLLGRPGCSHCIAFKPVITSVANNKEIDVYYLNTDTIETLETWDSIWGLVEQEGTPTVAVIENNKLVKSTAGEMTSEELIRFLSEAGAL
jgi:predicted bacteriocin transport accessory protein